MLEFVHAGGPLQQSAVCQHLFDGTLLAVDDATNELVWYAAGGAMVVKRLSCDTKPLDAVVCAFPRLAERTYPADDEQGPVRTSALAVLVTPDTLQLHLLNGQVFDIHLPTKFARVFAVRDGLLLQRKTLEVEAMAAASSFAAHTHASVNFGERFDPSHPGAGLFDGTQGHGGSRIGGFDANFDVKNWLDETIDLAGTAAAPALMSMTDIASPSFARTGHGFNPGATGASHHSDRVDLMSTRSSLPDLLEQYVQIAVDARPSPLFFSLAYPTAPVRPVKLNSVLIDSSGSNNNKGTPAARAAALPAPPSAAAHYTVLAVADDLVCTLRRDTHELGLWRLDRLGPPDRLGAGGADAAGGRGHESLLDQSSVVGSHATSPTIINSSVVRERERERERDVGRSRSSPVSFSSVLSPPSSGAPRVSGAAAGAVIAAALMTYETGAATAGAGAPPQQAQAASMERDLMGGIGGLRRGPTLFSPLIAGATTPGPAGPAGPSPAAAGSGGAPSSGMRFSRASSPAPSMAFSPAPLLPEYMAGNAQVTKTCHLTRYCA